ALGDDPRRPRADPERAHGGPNEEAECQRKQVHAVHVDYSAGHPRQKWCRHTGVALLTRSSECHSDAVAHPDRLRSDVPLCLVALTIGIVGLPNVGKSTLFSALTKNDVVAANYPFATIDPNVGVVGVPEPRLAVLAEIFGSARQVPATVTFVDIAGIVKGASEGQGLGNKFLANIREADAICQVIRVFD